MPHIDEPSARDIHFCGICSKQIANNHKYVDCVLSIQSTY